MRILLALFLMTTILIAGCNSGNNDASARTETNSQQTSASQEQEQTAQPAPSAPAAATQVSAEQNLAQTTAPIKVNSKLKEILAKSVKYKVTYDVTAAGTASQMTQYISDSNMRIDVAAQGIEARTYMVLGSNEITSCNKATGNWMCQKIAYTPTAADSAQDDVKKNVDSYAVVSTGSKIVAGVSTDCYRVTVKDGVVDYCYSADFVPLYVKTTAGAASSELTATSYSTTVTSADFILPAAVGAAVNPSDYLKNLPNVG